MNQPESLSSNISPNEVFILKQRYVNCLVKAALKSSFIDTTLTNRLHAAKPGHMLFIPDQLQSLVSNNTSIEATLEPDETLCLTREQSIHSVIFGRLALKGDDHVPVHEYVAYKPELSVEQAVREAAASRFINTENVAGCTYEPLGFNKQPDSKVALITRFAGRTVSFDNVLWKDSSEVTDEQIEDALIKAAISLAYLHASGITHGDAQPKNIAWDTQSNNPWYVDLETARRHMKDGDRKLFHAEAEYDLQTFMLYQSCMPSVDMFELVAEKYIKSYESQSNDSLPVKKDTIMQIASKQLKPLPIV
jgi:tRNA A-37 threonylcarbamoyl transferase component Bud32